MRRHEGKLDRNNRDSEDVTTILRPRFCISYLPPTMSQHFYISSNNIIKQGSKKVALRECRLRVLVFL
eukprot:m.29118 g.29118  ORF g.29118 m.29118 type:complete len:68 (+) comp16042_c0_seq1:71-274(+)